MEEKDQMESILSHRLSASGREGPRLRSNLREYPVSRVVDMFQDEIVQETFSLGFCCEDHSLGWSSLKPRLYWQQYASFVAPSDTAGR